MRLAVETRAMGAGSGEGWAEQLLELVQRVGAGRGRREPCRRDCAARRRGAGMACERESRAREAATGRLERGGKERGCLAGLRTGALLRHGGVQRDVVATKV